MCLTEYNEAETMQMIKDETRTEGKSKETLLGEPL